MAMLDFTITFSWILIQSLLWRGAHSIGAADEADGMGKSDKRKIADLGRELLIDAKVKQRQIVGVREAHKGMLAYEIGLVMGKIREKYKRMNDIYREVFDRKTGRTVMIPPAHTNGMKVLHFIISMELVHSMEVDIDKLIQVIELIPKSELGAPTKDMYAGLLPELSVLPSNKPDRLLRAGNDTSEVYNETSTQKFKSQDELKQHYRDKYNIRSGLNTNWSLDEYYGIV